MKLKSGLHRFSITFESMRTLARRSPATSLRAAVYRSAIPSRDSSQAVCVLPATGFVFLSAEQTLGRPAVRIRYRAPIHLPGLRRPGADVRPNFHWEEEAWETALTDA